MNRMAIAGIILFYASLVSLLSPPLSCEDDETKCEPQVAEVAEVPVDVERVVYVSTKAPCVQWEITSGDRTSTYGAKHIEDKSPKGWEPFAAVEHHTMLYRRCVKVHTP